jgi:hypothetical protein
MGFVWDFSIYDHRQMKYWKVKEEMWNRKQSHLYGTKHRNIKKCSNLNTNKMQNVKSILEDPVIEKRRQEIKI